MTRGECRWTDVDRDVRMVSNDGDGLTAALCAALTTQARSPLPETVAREARRSLLNVLGTAVGASRQPAVDIAVAYAVEHGGAPVAPIPGRIERTDVLSAALVTGLAAHFDDFDDTHLETVIHPGAATLGAVLATAVEHQTTGASALTAFALGCEAQLRVGAAMSPSHYDAGWHITGTCGVIGAAVAAGLLIDLPAETLAHAVGVAASQTLGLRDAFGTMTKPFHPGKAAANGVLAAKLGATGFTGPASLEHHQGYFAVLADDLDPARITEGWGEEWELLRNTYKPYPCGIVIHPVIDAAIALHPHVRDDPSTIDSVVVRCHPLVVELTGRPDPADGLEARFSAIHGAAAGLADGEVGLHQYTDERVRGGDLIALRAKVALHVDESLDRDAAVVEVHREGAVHRERVAHARGSLARPLSDEDLRGKVSRLVEPVLPSSTPSLFDAVEGLAAAPDLQTLVGAIVPHRAPAEARR